eukprot:NODE_26_length_40862_cov_0.679513.p11 type:complete len:407 gc:universal NODE_26_length_40862_cov_0.679513:25451-24231(-)
MEYLTDLENLKNYKYSSIDKSPLSKYFLNPYYWTPLSNYLPVWLHPNLVTLFGLLGIVLLLIITYAVDGLNGQYSWLSYLSAIAIWYYSTMDNLDGKQARRTQTSSPLGELVDHGCDAVQCCLGGLVQAAGMGLGYSYYTLWVIGIASVPFYISSWEEYFTKTLYLGYINGPTEGLLLGSLCSLVSAVFGPQIYFTPLDVIKRNAFAALLIYPFEKSVELAFLRLEIKKDLLLIDVLVFIMLLAVFIVHAPASMYNVYNSKHRKENMILASFKIYPIFVFAASGFLLATSPFFWIKNSFWLLIVGGTLSFAVYTTQVILAYIVSQHYPSPSAVWSFFSLSLFIRYSGLKTSDLTTITAIYTSFFAVYYFYFIYSVFSSFCKHLNMSWYIVPHMNQVKLLSEKPKKK